MNEIAPKLVQEYFPCHSEIIKNIDFISLFN